MRLLGIDLGSVRVGVAVCDELGLAARPLSVLRRRGGARDLDAIERLVREQEAGAVVLGLPLNMDGSEGPVAQRTRRFAAALEERLRPLGVPVRLWDERLTSWEAEDLLREKGLTPRRRRERVDAVAAALILESYLAGDGASTRENER